MEPHLEVRHSTGERHWTPLGAERLSIGRDPSNDVSLNADATVSRLHAVIERYRAGWCLKDLDSSNGTFVNGVRVHHERLLRPGDEIRIGKNDLIFRGPGDSVLPTTAPAEPRPNVTAGERAVLVALCRPMFTNDAFPEPASVQQIAQRLTLEETTVKTHLRHLYDKFDIPQSGRSRRVQLANAALRRGVIGRADL